RTPRRAPLTAARGSAFRAGATSLSQPCAAGVGVWRLGDRSGRFAVHCCARRRRGRSARDPLPRNSPWDGLFFPPKLGARFLRISLSSNKLHAISISTFWLHETEHP